MINTLDVTPLDVIHYNLELEMSNEAWLQALLKAPDMQKVLDAAYDKLSVHRIKEILTLMDERK